MKTFTYKVLIIVIAVLFSSLFIKGIIQIGDTTITQESSKNYNGYLPLYLEDSLIYLDDFYEVNKNDYGYELITYNVISNYRLPVFGYIKVQTDNGLVFNGYCHMVNFNATGIFIDDLTEDGISVLENDGIYILFYGYSNYDTYSYGVQQ